MGVRGIILAHGGRAVVSPYPPVRRVVRVKKLWSAGGVERVVF